MKRIARLFLPAALAFAGVALPAAAQSNTIPGTDVLLGILGNMKYHGRQGSFPTGSSGFSMSTTSCNAGTVNVPWEEAMDADHPFIAFLATRESDGRMVQISDRSHVKHAFFALANNQCGFGCQGGSPFGNFLGIGCSDTYGVENNGDRYWLGPASEIDPWLGLWNPVCSYFDRGDPKVNSPNDCDGNRSLNQAQVNAMNVVKNRMTIDDAELDLSGDFYYQGYYVVRGESEATREDNLGSREFNPHWTGSVWNVPVSGSLVDGSILKRWSGATVTSGKNANDDGRVYVAVKVTGPVDGMYHYEYALHNRDNRGGVSALRIPVCPDAVVTNFGFRDIDRMVLNDWSVARNGSEIAFTDGAGNPLAWNTIYNFWFDSDAAPESGAALVLDQNDPGSAATQFSVSGTAPTGLYNAIVGPGCSDTTPPSLFATGSPAQATLGNASFALKTTGNDPSSVTFAMLSFNLGTTSAGNGCDVYMSGLFNVDIFLLGVKVTNGTGEATFAAPIPSSTILEGVNLHFQLASYRAAGGPYLGSFDLSNGLLVRIGNNVTGCP